jgi:hypothetical protein
LRVLVVAPEDAVSGSKKNVDARGMLVSKKMPTLEECWYQRNARKMSRAVRAEKGVPTA